MKRNLNQIGRVAGEGLTRRALFALLVLTGCGFAPALGPGGPAQKLIGAVRAADPGTQGDYDFVTRIEERLGRAGAARYALSYVISTGADGVAITADGAITRYRLAGSADWTLTRTADGLRMAGGTVQNFTGYSATGSTVAGQSARQDAARRLMRILADQVVSELSARSAGFAP